MDGVAVVMGTLAAVAAVNLVFDYLFDALRKGRVARRGYVWLPRDLTPEDLDDVATWRAEQAREIMAAADCRKWTRRGSVIRE